jgi:hypothetical protein
MSPVKRAGLSLLGALVLTLSAASPAPAATQVGELFTPDITCASSYTFIQTTSIGDSYAVPTGGGIITSWSHTASDSPPTGLKLKVGRPTGIPDTFTIVGQSPPHDPVTGANTFTDVRIAVEAGDVIGLYMSGAGDCVDLPGPAYAAHYRQNEDTAPGETEVFSESPGRLAVAASVEADADGDGYGDETQDQCPQLATTQGPCPDGDGDGVSDLDDDCPAVAGPASNNGCPLPDTEPPETTITKQPKDKSSKKKAKYGFSSDDPAATFECKIDKKPYEPCTSPKKFKAKKGKHKFKVRATDAAGNVDPTPAKDKFKVTG